MKALTMIIFGISFTILLLISGCIEYSYLSHYQNKKALLEDKAIERGWVPEIIPDSAYGILEDHDYETNQSAGCFYYKEEDEKMFLKNLIKEDEDLRWEEFYFAVDTQINKILFANFKMNRSMIQFWMER